MPDQRSSTPVVVVAFLAGLAAGVALTWLFDGRSAGTAGAPLTVDRGEQPVGSGHDAGQPALHTAGRPSQAEDSAGPDSDGRVAPPPPALPYEPPADLDLPPGVAGWIRVDVVSPNPDVSISGEAYVLSPGADGLDDLELVPHGYPNDEEPAVIALGRPGRYDVGFVWQQSHFLRRDVLVVAGETTTVVFQPPVAQQLTVTLADPLPQRPGWETMLNLRLVGRGNEEAISYPGRGQRLNRGWSGNIASGTHKVGNLFEGDRVKVTGVIFQHRTHPKAETKFLYDRVVVASPPEAGPGEAVTIKLAPACKVRVRARFDWPSWPVGVHRALDVEIEHVGGVDRHAQGVARYPNNKEGDFYTWNFTVPEGPVRVRWSGIDLQPGRAPVIQARPGAAQDVSIDLTFTGRHPRDRGRPLWVDVAWPKDADKDAVLELAAVVREPRRREAEAESWVFERERTTRRSEPELRRVRKVLGSIGDTHATGPITIPSAEALLVRPIRGGLIVLAPEVTRSDSMGQFVLRRPDGLAIRIGEQEYQPDVPVVVGQVIGPFVPGEHTFHLWLASQRLPDVKVTVRAGRTSALIIPE